MKLKVKIKDTALTIDTITIPDDATVHDLIDILIEKEMVTHECVQDLFVEGYGNIEGEVALKALFDRSDKAYLSSGNMRITLTVKDGEALLNQALLDYSEVVRAVKQYDAALMALAVRPGTVFFVQLEGQYLVRRERWGIEVFDFRTQYAEAFYETGRRPCITIELKGRDALTKEELKWVRRIMFPAREKRNPLIRLINPPITQRDIDVIAALIHHVTRIMGTFQGRADYLESNDDHLPTYVQLGTECSIGYIERTQLEAIR